jgi:hypothetical protein
MSDDGQILRTSCPAPQFRSNVDSRVESSRYFASPAVVGGVSAGVFRFAKRVLMRASVAGIVVLVILMPAGLSVQAGTSTPGSESQFLIVTNSETMPNGIPPGAGEGIYGNTNPVDCAVANDTPGDNCYDPLYFTFDAIDVSMPADGTIQGADLANLATTGSQGNNNLLETTNSVGSADGGIVSLTASFGCPSATNTLTGQITVAGEDGSAWTFLVDPDQPCAFSLTTPITGTFVSIGGLSSADSGTFSIYVYPNSTFAGTYTGTFDGSTSPGTGASTSNITFAIDPTSFAVTGSLSLPAESLGACQPSDDTFSTALAMEQLPPDALVTPTAAAYTTGGSVFMILTDAAGNQEWAAGSVTDASDALLPAGQLFWTAYGASGECTGIYSWDKIFTKKTREFSPSPRPRPRRILRIRRNLPRNWQQRGAFDPRDWRFQQLNHSQPYSRQDEQSAGFFHPGR